ncbi:MAG: rod shape-determining protein MreC [Betaproteobacteria bacterium]|nr:rod shape-determining protein MreC [Betaproteobacteria bacterium]
MSVYQENFFTRGPSPLARVVFFAIVSIGVMIADHRFQALGWMRSVVSAMISPIETALAWPGQASRAVGLYFAGQHQLVEENRTLKTELLELAAARAQADQLKSENRQLLALRGEGDRFADQGQIAEIVRDARNPFARKIIIDRGSRHGIAAGRAVIDGAGVVGQVTAVGLMTSEVTLTTEKDHSVPVMVVRNGLRALAVGAGREGTLEVPFIPLGADIQVGDMLVTSGIDGTYPAGLAVATVSAVDKNPADSFARIVAVPVASASSHRRVKVFTQAELHDYPRPDVPEAADPGGKSGKPPRRGPAAPEARK